MAQRLIVEGKNDIKVIGELCKQRNLPSPLGYEERKYKDFVIVSGSIEKLRLDVETVFTVSEITNIGIVLDADVNIASRWQSICDVLRQQGYGDLPDEPSVEGTIIVQANLPKIGIWIMPNNQLTGYLEHFVELMIPEEDTLFPIAQYTTQNLIDSSQSKFRLVDKQKADIHTWLAWQENPGVPMGTAINNKYLSAESPIAIQFINWIKNTFQYPSP